MVEAKLTITIDVDNDDVDCRIGGSGSDEWMGKVWGLPAMDKRLKPAMNGQRSQQAHRKRQYKKRVR